VRALIVGGLTVVEGPPDVDGTGFDDAMLRVLIPEVVDFDTPDDEVAVPDVVTETTVEVTVALTTGAGAEIDPLTVYVVVTAEAAVSG
jgi:hypothetical protein